ncbi:MAG: sugar phosphate isomerase/epimerase family protein [Planctomycetota bacterium]
MKISMMSYTMARGFAPGQKFDVRALCEFTRELGLDAVDWVTTYGRDPRDIRKITDDFGLANVCHTFKADLNFATSAERAPGREEFRRGIEAAIVLGAGIVMLPVAGKGGLSREQSFRNVVSGLAEVVDLARAAGVTVTVEHFGSTASPFVTSDDVNRAVSELPDLRITYDNGNVTTGGEEAGEAFRRSAEHVVHAHFKDYEVCPEGTLGAKACLDGKFRRSVLLGDGDVDQMGVLRAMKDSGYSGCINFEYEGSELTPREATIEGVRRMREMIAQIAG